MNEEIDIYSLAKKVIQNEQENIANLLSPREIELLKFRLGLADGNKKTLEETGKKLGITRERARQIEALALRKIMQSDFASKYTD